MKSTLELVKPIWKYSDKKVLQIPNFELKHKTLGNLKVRVFNRSNNINSFSTRIYNSKDEVLGVNSFGSFENQEDITGFYMQTHLKYRGRRLGELLRLISIMVLDKNNKKAIDIYSKDSAVFFHAKYKFESNITSFNERVYALYNIAKNNAPEYAAFSEKAKSLLKEIQGACSVEANRRLNVSVNKLINEYIRTVLKSQKCDEHKFANGFSMKLNRENVKENNKFFNKLFKEHGIDYTV